MSFLSEMNASMYASMLSQRTVLSSVVIAIIIAIIGARTDRHAFIAQAHGIRDWFFCPSALMPVGKGMPMKKPRGIREIKVINILNLRP